MKLGYRLRRIHSIFINTLKQSFNLFYYLFWFLFEANKFKPKPKELKNILIVSAGALGDGYNLLGFLNQATKKYPQKKIYYLTPQKNKKFVKNPKIKCLNLEEAKILISQNLFDCALLISNPFAIFDKLMYKKIKKIPYLVGFNDLPITPFIREIIPKRKFFLHLNHMILQKPHYVKNWPVAFKKIGLNLNKDKLIFHFTKQGEKEAKKFITRNKKHFSNQVIFLHPYGGSAHNAIRLGQTPSHVWPIEKWAKLADLLISKYKTSIVFTGNKDDEKIIQKIRSKMKNKSKTLDSSGKLSIETLAYLMRNKGKFLVAIDTGIAHIGALCGIFVVDIFSSYPPTISAPLTKKRRIIYKNNSICKKCIKHGCAEGNPICTNTITVKEVLEATKNI